MSRANVAHDRIGGVLLAAGRARRFGSDKLRAALADGRPVGLVSAQRLAAAVDTSVVVLPPGHPQRRAQFESVGHRVVVCAQAELGMGHSLGCGVAALRACAGWLIALADMPCIAPRTLEGIVALLRDGAAIVVPRAGGRAGHPVGFSREFADELCSLEGDRGARGVVARHRARVRYFDCDDVGIHADIDVPEDLPGVTFSAVEGGGETR